MLAWLHQRIAPPWSRRTRWTPLLETQREFQRTLAKERARVDRNGGFFGFVIVRLVDLKRARGQSTSLAKLLHRRLRETDSKGHLGFGRIGLMLPMTDHMGSELVLEDVTMLAKQCGIAIEGEAFVYPEPRHGGQGSGQVENQVQLGTSVNSASAAPEQIVKMLSVMVPRFPFWKRSLDVLGAGMGLLAFSPVLLAAAAAIKLTSPGPILYCQMRTGYLGRHFRIYKLRSMVVNADELKGELRERNERDGPAFKMRQDPRITLVGKALRATGLDELPQLVNVLSGDMSLVGPRPLPIEEAQQCSPWQARRREVKPGLTCFWQISKSRQMSFAEWMRLDMEYVRRASLKLDLFLIVKTLGSVFLGRVGH